MKEFFELDATAVEALEAARALPPGPKRTLAMKEAGRLRMLAEKLREAYTPPKRMSQTP